MKIVVPGYEDKPSWQTPINTKYNETYYNEKNKGNRSYKIINIGADDLADGEYSVKSNGNEHIFTIPLYTRAKELVTKQALQEIIHIRPIPEKRESSLPYR